MRSIARSGLFLLTLLVFTVVTPTAAMQTSTQEAASLLEAMSPKERVGQLFLITFNGTNPSTDAAVFDLIRNHHISGVVLSSTNGNFVTGEDSAQSLLRLINRLQQAELDSSILGAEENAGTEEVSSQPPGSYVPLLIGVGHEIHTSSLSASIPALSEQPSQMAIGAAWDVDLAESAGEILGRELRALGVNLLIGPSLDVLEDPQISASANLGVRTFGGDPYWVSENGKSYVRGVQVGSDGQVGVIVKHFPGLGSSDRPIEEEVATVRKSLNQLQQIELPPFLAVAGGVPGEEEGIADGILTSHIRFQGFQGNIRATTRPVSLDPEAFSQLLNIEPLKGWREAGGITLSDSMGSRAIRRFYGSLGSGFKGHLVARDAFLAGNDLIYLSNFLEEQYADQAETIRATLAFFTQKYEEDPVFAQRVDEAVLRILQFKLRIMGGEFTPDQILREESALSELGTQNNVALQVARAGASLISPTVEDIRERLGGQPQIGDRILFITDVRMSQQCANCELRPGISVDALEQTVLSLYGPQAAGQVGGWNSSSYTMADLAVYLGDSPQQVLPYTIVEPEEIGSAIQLADWLVFVTLKTDPAVFGSGALRKLLDLRPDIAQDKKVVVFTHDVPYDLDATEISKIDAYYALYAQSPSFVEVAARLLFLEIPVEGASPVSIPGIGYEMIQVTSPDPDQLIRVFIQEQTASGTPIPTPDGYSIGDSAQLRTGVILDKNGNPVPDGTPVRFVITYQGENIPSLLETTTVDGVGIVQINFDRIGTLSIRAESEPARTSEILQINVQDGEPGEVRIITPTVIPTETVVPTNTPEQLTPTPEVTPTVVDSMSPPPPEVTFGDLGIALLGIGLTMVGVAATVPRYVEVGIDKIRLCILAALGGLAGYNYLAFNLPGTQDILSSLGGWGVIAIVLMGAMLVLGGMILWVRSGRKLSLRWPRLP